MKKKNIMILALCLSMLLIITGCSGNNNQNNNQNNNNNSQQNTSNESSNDENVNNSNNNEQEQNEKEAVKLEFLYPNAGNDSQYELNNYYFDNFNEMYEGEYEIVVEWLPGMAEDIRAKLKVLNASNDLPALVTNLGPEPAFAELLIENDRLMDLKPYFDESEEWKEVCIDKSIEFNTTKDGKMYTKPAVTTSYTGIYYNKEHFSEVGYETIPDTWEEFWVLCDKLEEAGHDPISLHTTETGWCTMLFATAYMVRNDEGKEFMTVKYPKDFMVDPFVDGAEFIKRLFSYTTSDAVGGKYALAANNFTATNTSMIANGPWMIASLSDPEYSPEGFEEIVGYATFPEGIMMSGQGQEYGDGVSMDHPIEVREGVVEFMKFLAMPENIRYDGVVRGNFSEKIPLTDEELDKLSPAMQEYSKAINKVEDTVLNYQSMWDPITQNEVIPTELPSLVTEQISVEEFCEKMTEGAKRYEEEAN